MWHIRPIAKASSIGPLTQTGLARLLICLFFFPAYGHAQKVYWINGPNYMGRANLDGSGVEFPINSIQGGIGIAVDPIAAKVYWTDAAANKIQRANLDGTAIEDLLTKGLVLPWGIALDVPSGKMYWTERGAGRIGRANLDGSDAEILLGGLGAVEGLALDLEDLKMYWTAGQSVHRAKLDGTGAVVVVTEPPIPTLYVRDVGVDTIHDRVYWLANDLFWFEYGVIRRAQLDGSKVQTLVPLAPSFTEFPQWMSLAVDRDEVYWTDYRKGIRRASLKGDDVVQIVPFQHWDGRGIALDLTLCCRPFGDLVPQEIDGYCLIDVDDISCVLDDFIQPGTCFGADLYPCGGDSIIDVDDIVAELEAFTGYAACETQCP